MPTILTRDSHTMLIPRRRPLVSPLGLLLLLAVLAARPAQAGAGDETQSVVMVSGGSAAIDVSVNPALITSVFLPEPVTRILASDQKHFAVRAMGNAVVIKPLTSNPSIQANVVVTSASLNLTLVLRVTDEPAAAQAQIVVKKAEVEAALEKRIDAEVARRLAASKAAMQTHIRQAIGLGLAQRFDVRVLRAADRNGDNVIVRVPRRVRVGRDSYVSVTIQNRSSRPFALARAEILAAGHDLSAGLIFEGKVARGPVLGTVAPGARADAILIARDVDRIKTETATLILSEAGGRRRVRVGGVDIR